MKTFQKLQKDLGMEVALESFRKVLAAVEEDIFHDPLVVQSAVFEGIESFVSVVVTTLSTIFMNVRRVRSASA